MDNFQLFNNKKIKSTLLFFIYLIPIAIVIWFTYSFGVNVPFGDQWELVKLFDKVDKNIVTFQDFFSQHNEHRIVIPKIIFVGLAFASKWNVKLEMYFSIFIAIATFCFIYKIAEFTSKKHNSYFHLFNILSAFIFFSLVQSENWLWGFQIAWFFINFCLILAVFILATPGNISPKIRLTGAALCCFIASFSSAHGLFSWLALIPLIITVEGTRKKRINRLILWLILFGLCCFIYSIGYYKPPSHSSFSLSFLLANAKVYIIYFLRLISSSVRITDPGKTGIFIFVLFVFFNIYFIKKYSSRVAINIAPWLSIGWFTVLFAVIAAVGRSDLGGGQALSSRYKTVSMLLIISCIQMWRVLIEEPNFLIGKTFLKSLISLVIAGTIAFSLLINSNQEITDVKIFRKSRIIGQNCLEKIYFLDKNFEQSIANDERPKNCLHYLYPLPKTVKKSSVILARLGFINYYRNITFNLNPIDSHGKIEFPLTTDKAINLSINNNLTIKGWAGLAKSNQPSTLILLSYGNHRSFFANAQIVELNSSNNRITWQAEINSQSLPAGETTIKTWVYDRENKQFVQLQGEVKVNNNSKF